MYPFGSLPENLAAFSAQLRREHRFRIGPRELLDASRALLIVPLGDERAVRNALRPVLCGSADNVAVFDRAFEAFFHPERGAQRVDAPASLRSGQLATADARVEHDDVAGVSLGSDNPEAGVAESAPRGDTSRVPDGSTDEVSREAVVRSSYSPLEGEGAAPHLAVDPRWRPAARAFVASLRLGLSRRWRPAPHGQRFDVRRTLRHSLHTGGEPVIPRWQTRPRRDPRIVFLVDGSRSMGTHAQVALDMAVALAGISSRLEAFTFSTTLERVTREVRRAAAGDDVRLDHLHRAWGGGTSIGASLDAFLHRFGERCLGRDSVVVVASDGLDVGAASVVREAMAGLRRRSAAIIWLNPLLDTPGYEPSARGMRAARPYVSTFACVGGPADLLRLSRVVRLRN